MESQDRPNISLLLFLGAGASVPADVPDTKEFVTKFEDHMRDRDGYGVLEQILNTLKRYAEANPDRQVDIELLLECLDALDNRTSNILDYFIEGGKYLLEGATEKAPIREELREFIRKNAIIDKEKVGYLEPLRELLARYGPPRDFPLSIFTVNYDNCIEQFCSMYSIGFTDGFLVEWSPQQFESHNYDIHLFKLHGSTNWFRTPSGRYCKGLYTPDEGEIRLDTGEMARTSIVYPGSKPLYYGPHFEMLGMLRERLSRTKIAVVVGYSFRDDGIKRIFWDAASRNRDLVLVLISPSASEVYSRQLAKQDDGTPSPLEDRVLVLPFLFQKVLPVLHMTYVSNLRHALNEETSLHQREILREPVDSASLLRHYANCGFAERILRKMSSEFIMLDWSDMIENSAESVAHILARGDPEITENGPLLEFFENHFAKLFCGDLIVHVREGGSVAVSLVSPCEYSKEPASVHDISEVLRKIRHRVDEIAKLVPQDRVDGIHEFFKPFEDFEVLYPSKIWKAEISSVAYGDLRRKGHEEDIGKIEKVISTASQEVLEPDDTEAIADIVRSIEGDELEQCFADWKPETRRSLGEETVR